MGGLILADLLTMGRMYKIFSILIVLALATCAFGGGLVIVSLVCALMVGQYVTGAIAYDETSRWQQYCLTMPFSRRQLVTEKYLLTILCGGCAWLLCALALALQTALDRGVTREELPAILAVLLAMEFLSPALSLPVLFRVGTQKGRIVNFVAYVAVYMVGYGVVSRGGVFLMQLAPALPALCVVASALLLALSWALACRFYARREF